MRRIGRGWGPTGRVRRPACTPIAIGRGGERRSARYGRLGAALHQAWPSAASRTGRQWRSGGWTDWRQSQSSRSFFCTDRPFDRSWMDIESEFLLDQRRQLARAYRLTRRDLRSEECQYLALDFVRAAGASLFGHKPGNAPFLEIRFGLVIGWPRDSRSRRTHPSPRPSRQRRDAASRTSPARHRADRRIRLLETSDRGPSPGPDFSMPSSARMSAFERLRSRLVGTPNLLVRISNM